MFSSTPTNPGMSHKNSGPIGWRSVVALTTAGAGIVAYYNYKNSIQKHDLRPTRTVGKPSLGGPWNLVDSRNGQRLSDVDFRGQYTLLYFGFTFCPDVCPEELVKLGNTLDVLDKDYADLPTITPIMITVDPHRDTVEQLEKYRQDFHKRLICLTGSDEEIAQVTRDFRVYFSIPEDKEGDDYLVDHSIFFYLMDRNGKLIDFYGKNFTSDELVTKISTALRQDLASTSAAAPAAK